MKYHFPLKLKKKITWSILPDASDLNGLSGTMFKKVSSSEGALLTVMFWSILRLLTSDPGPMIFAKFNDMVIAKKVVVIYKIIDLNPILPKLLRFFRLQTPQTNEKKTTGTTIIFKVLRNNSPPKVKKIKMLLDDCVSKKS